uniref:SMP-LTD domain-containing protein n=1 Tax=Cyclopterus lumpus TaxID=8103 RepID=A0A8C3AL42_CYCLU
MRHTATTLRPSTPPSHTPSTSPWGAASCESVVEGKEEDERAEKHTVPDRQLPVTLYLFGRTGREKEEWFQHFLSASRAGAQSSVSREENAGKTVPWLHLPGPTTHSPCACVCHSEAPCAGDAAREGTELHDLPGALKTRMLLEYSTYMTQLIGPQSCNPAPSPCQAGDEPRAGSVAEGRSAEGQPTWVNSLVGRIFWDFLREKYWTDQVAHKIQKKLSKIKLPYFMNELTLADLDMGTCLPQVLSTSTPTLDRRGLWLELEVMYTGCLQMSLQTKMNLCKLGKDVEDEAHSVLETHSKPRLCVLADSDEESSSAGSSDEEEASPFEPQASLGEKSTMVAAEGHTGGSTSRKILRFVDKIAKSKYFQKATENEYIRKKIAEVSNMPLMLSVEVLELSGTLAINIPPPPTDRIWYSFRVPPRLDLHVRPTLGEREVTFTHVTEWIERKLQCEFQKVLVMPNMDDLYLPLMTSGLENPPASHQSSIHSSSHQSSMESQDYLSE